MLKPALRMAGILPLGASILQNYLGIKERRLATELAGKMMVRSPPCGRILRLGLVFTQVHDAVPVARFRGHCGYMHDASLNKNICRGR